MTATEVFSVCTRLAKGLVPGTKTFGLMIVSSSLIVGCSSFDSSCVGASDLTSEFEGSSKSLTNFYAATSS